MPNDKLYRIKPLVWKQVRDGLWTAKCPPVDYVSIQYAKADGRYAVWTMTRGISTEHTLEIAKAAADKWYRESLTAALEEVPHAH